MLIKINIMNLNPLNSNYLNNLAFDRNKNRKLASSPSKKLTQPNVIKKANPQKPQRTEPSPQKQEKYYCKSVEFQLRQKLNTSQLFYSREGYMFGLQKRDGCIEKKAAIVFPDGTVASCYVQRGKLNGWAVLCKKNSFYNIFQYKNSRLEGYQFIYDIKCGLMLRSNYLNGRLNSVQKYCAQNQTKFQKFVNNKEIYNILKETLNNQFFKNNFPYVQCTMGNFYGKKTGEIPHGLGIVITPQQLFYGEFERGLLNGIGTISFQDGNYYIGQLQSGLTKGIGQFSTNGKTTYKYNDVRINEEIFNGNFQIAGWEQVDQINRVFHPIITFYQKLRKIQLERINDTEGKDTSVVDVEFAPQEQEREEGIDRKDSSSSPRTDRETDRGIDRERLGIITNDQTMKKQAQQFYYNDTPTPINNKKDEGNLQNPDKQEEIVNEKKNPGKLFKNDNKRMKKKPKNKEKTRLLNDNEWEEIIEELQGQQSIGKEDGFLKPAKQNVKQCDKDEISTKPNPNNFNQKRIDLIKINGPDIVQITENQESSLSRMLKKTNKIP